MINKNNLFGRKDFLNCFSSPHIANDSIAQTEENSNINSSENETIENILEYSTIHLLREKMIIEHRPPKNSISELVFYNDIDSLKAKIETGNLDLNLTDSIGTTHTWTPLYWSVKLRRVECINLLLENGADMNLVINDSEECCGTVLDLATLREDEEIEELLRTYAEKEDVNLGQSFKAIRTKLRGKAPAFNFRYYSKNTPQENIEHKKQA